MTISWKEEYLNTTKVKVRDYQQWIIDDVKNEIVLETIDVPNPKYVISYRPTIHEKWIVENCPEQDYYFFSSNTCITNNEKFAALFKLTWC